LIAIVGATVWEEDMAGIVAGQRLVRWDHERVTLEADDVLIVRPTADLLGLQLMLFFLAAAARLDPPDTGLPSQPLSCALSLSTTIAVNATNPIGNTSSLKRAAVFP
jgi:hypothetical protein